jgi:hypothetical protein
LKDRLSTYKWNKQNRERERDEVHDQFSDPESFVRSTRSLLVVVEDVVEDVDVVVGRFGFSVSTSLGVDESRHDGLMDDGEFNKR